MICFRDFFGPADILVLGVVLILMKMSTQGLGSSEFGNFYSDPLCGKQ